MLNAQSATDTNLRSTDVERYTPKFLKNWETQLFQKYLGIRFASDTKDALLIIAEVPSSRSFSAVCKFHLHSASVGSRRLIPTCNRLIACWYDHCLLAFHAEITLRPV